MSAASPPPLPPPQLPFSPRRPPPRPISKELHFNHDLSATKKLQAGVDLVANLVGVTLGPKGRNVVLSNKYGPPKIVNDGETILKEIELEDAMENVGVKLVRQAGARTNDIAGDGCTTSIVLAQGLISEGNKVLAAGMNPVQIARGIEQTAKVLVSELNLLTREVQDEEIANVAAVSAGNDYAVGNMIAEALRRVGRKGAVRIEDGRCSENDLKIVEGMQFDRGYLSPYFVTNRADMSVEFNDCKILLVDKKITNPKDMFRVLDSAVKEKFQLLIIAEDFEPEALALLIRNKLKGVMKAAAIKAPSFGDRKSDYLNDIAALTGGTVIKDEMGMTLEEASKEVLGSAAKVVISKDSTLIVTDGSTQHLVEKRVSQLRSLSEYLEEKFQKKILNERIARLCGGIAIIQVGAQTVVELKDKKLRIEDALNATKAAIEEGVVVGGGCALLRLSTKVDGIKESLDNKEQKIGADILKRALSYPAKLIAKNAGVNGNVVVQKILSNGDTNYGYNAAKNCYQDLVAAGILDPSKVILSCLAREGNLIELIIVDLSMHHSSDSECSLTYTLLTSNPPEQVVRCCLEHAVSVAKAFLTSDLVIVDGKQTETTPTRAPAKRPPPMSKPMRPPMPAPNSIPFSDLKLQWHAQNRRSIQ